MRPILLILGPTAGGKTRLAIDLAKRLPSGGECISADSMQVYRGMDIGTAKPTPQEQAEAPHHLLDLIEPSDDGFSVDRWLELAEQTIQAVRARGRWPIVVGGTNLYVQAFLGGLADLPPPDPVLREKLAAMEQAELFDWLKRIDPPAAARIHPNDRKRTIRAIEVFEQTGKRLSDLQTQWESAMPARAGTSPSRLSAGTGTGRLADTIIIGLEYPVEVINRRINARVKAMIQLGLIEEVRRLHEAGVLGRNAREALGYKQILDYLEGRASLEQAIEQIKIRTRRFAKQQRTWLRRFRAYPNSIWIDAAELSPQEIANKALTSILGRLSEPIIYP